MKDIHLVHYYVEIIVKKVYEYYKEIINLKKVYEYFTISIVLITFDDMDIMIFCSYSFIN